MLEIIHFFSKVRLYTNLLVTTIFNNPRDFPRGLPRDAGDGLRDQKGGLAQPAIM
jgi:hypothetical protein